ncbi:hypothetical protein BRM32_14260, partial [Xanthomonas oryzae pv. oryzae]
MGCDAPAGRRILFCPEIRARTKRGEPTAPYTKLGAFKLPNSTVLQIIVPLCHYWKTFRPRGRAVL